MIAAVGKEAQAPAFASLPPADTSTFASTAAAINAANTVISSDKPSGGASGAATAKALSPTGRHPVAAVVAAAAAGGAPPRKALAYLGSDVKGRGAVGGVAARGFGLQSREVTFTLVGVLCFGVYVFTCSLMEKDDFS